MAEALDTCAVCPRLCRPACPVAMGSGREAAVPAVIAEVVRAWRDGRVGDDLAREAATLCVGCGGCTEHCHLAMPLPEALAAARRALLPPVAVPPPPVLDTDAVVVLLAAADAEWPARWAGRTPAAVVVVPDEAALDHAPQDYLLALSAAVGSREVVVADGASARVAVAAGLSPRFAVAVGGRAAHASCCGGAARVGAHRPACCGAAGPLSMHHPATAARLGARYGAALPEGALLEDARCAAHLRRVGVNVAAVPDGATR